MDQMHFHIDELQRYLMDWRQRLEGGAFKSERQWLHTNYLDSECNAEEYYGPREPGPNGRDYTDSEDEGDVENSKVLTKPYHQVEIRNGKIVLADPDDVAKRADAAGGPRTVVYE